MSLDSLHAAAQSGEPRARNALYAALYTMLRGYFGRRGEYVEVDDLVQTTLVAIVGRIASFVPAHAKAFEYLVYDLAHDVLRAKHRSRVREADRRVFVTPDVVAPDTSPSAHVARREQFERVAHAIGELGPIDQRTLGDHVDGTDWRELVEREGITRPSLRGRLHRALARVRVRLGQAESALLPQTSPT